MEQSFVIGSVPTNVGNIPRASVELSTKDRWGTFKVRWGVGRMNYKVDPGLYALGEPGPDFPVVTANYKLSFDALRSALPGRNFWILAVDTDGINVWCAAGKGTFSTEELVNRIESSSLAQLVSHRRLIVPQLAAPGVAAHRVRELSGFKIKYGPIRSNDLPAFIDQNFKATPDMRLRLSPQSRRVVLIPVELVEALKGAVVSIPLFFLLGGLIGSACFWTNAMNHGIFASVGLVKRHLRGSGFDTHPPALAPRQSFLVQRRCFRAIGINDTGSSHTCILGPMASTVGFCCLGLYHNSGSRFSWNEFYRRFHLYFVIRCEKGDALGLATGNHSGLYRSGSWFGSNWIV